MSDDPEVYDVDVLELASAWEESFRDGLGVLEDDIGRKLTGGEISAVRGHALNDIAVRPDGSLHPDIRSAFDRHHKGAPPDLDRDGDRRWYINERMKDTKGS